jgi:hypothetical protein
MKPYIVVVTRGRASIRKSGEEFENELKRSFFVELLLFGLLVAISAWPILQTAEALRLL